MGDRLPLDGLHEMDLHAALRKRRAAHEKLRQAQREAIIAEQEVARAEKAMGLNQSAEIGRAHV